jgi:hypothetical protein
MSAPRPPPPNRSPFEYPLCCGMETTLSVFGWRCQGACGGYTVFRDDQGRTALQLEALRLEALRQRPQRKRQQKNA